MADHAHMLSQHWNDILLPAPPLLVNSELLWASIVLLLLAILGVAVFWQLRPRQTARRALRRNRRALQIQNVDTRTIAYRTYRAIFNGLQIKSGLRQPAAADAKAWFSFYWNLQACVFASQPPSRDEVHVLIRDGFYWLDHYAPR